MKVFLAEDHSIVRNGIKMLLEGDPEISVVGEGMDGVQSLEFVERGNPVDTSNLVTDSASVGQYTNTKQYNTRDSAGANP